MEEQHHIDYFEPQEQRTLLEWLDLVLKKWKIATFVFLVVFTAGTHWSYVQFKNEKPLYTSTSLIMIGPESMETATDEGQVVRQFYSYQDEINLLKSEIIARQAAIVLREKFGYTQTIGKLMLDVKSSLKIETTVLGGSMSGRQNTLVISSTTGEAKKSYDIILSVIEGYQKQKKEDEAKFFKDTYKTFSAQLDMARENLHKAELSLTEFVLSNKEVGEVMKEYGIEEKDTIDPSALNKKYIEIKAGLEEINNFLQEVKDMAVKNRVESIDLISKKYPNPINADLKKALIDKTEELDWLLVANEEAHPQVIKVRSELSSIENKIDLQIEDGIKSIKREIAESKAKEERLASLIAAGIHEKFLTYHSLKRDIDVKREIYNKLSLSLQQINLGEKMRRYKEIRILEEAKLPSVYTRSNRIFHRNLLISFLMAVFCSFGTVYLLEMFDTSIKSVEQLERVTGLPVLATIPTYKRPKGKREAQ